MIPPNQNLLTFEEVAPLLKDEFEKYGSLIHFDKNNNPFNYDEF